MVIFCMQLFERNNLITSFSSMGMYFSVCHGASATETIPLHLYAS